MQYLRNCKRLKLSSDKEETGVTAIKSAFDSKILRSGDKVGEREERDLEKHPNQYDAAQVIVNGFRQVGNSKTVRQGVEGSTHELGILSSVSSAMGAAQKRFVASRVDALAKGRKNPVFARFYDCTPNRLRFGRLQEEIQPHARYAHFTDGKYELLGMADFIKKNPKAGALRYGTVQLLAQSLTCHSACEKGELDAFKVFSGPKVNDVTQKN